MSSVGSDGGPEPSLAGLRILLVEDEGAISLLLESLLQALGCRVVGVAASLDEALALSRGVVVDIALLDVNIAGTPVYPLAEQLRARSVPIVFSTGYGVAGLAEPWRSAPVLLKPFTVGQLASVLRRVRQAQTGACAGAYTGAGV